ncbi:MAG: helix-turn-helix domain-containing protein [Nanoarchaeota archaeon]|nr:helix-turn-helix domain-containing protein [Nanoarchaeota archaeon]
MWYLKFKLKHSDCIVSPLAEKYNLNIEFYPLGHYFKGDFIYTSSIHTAKGREENIKKYIRDLKKDKRIKRIEVSKVIFTLAKEPASKKTYQIMYSPQLLYITPGFNASDGSEVWEIACWDRKPLVELIDVMERATTTTYFEVLKFEEKNIDDIYILKLFPELPKKQKEAINLAYKLGYYQFPKKTDLNKLSKIAGISKSTFQENLKKAEARLMPLLLRK